MEKEQSISYSIFYGKTCEDMKVKLHAVYKDHAPSLTIIRYKKYNEFKRGRTSVFDEEQPGRPIEMTAEDMVNKIHDIVLADCRVKVREIADIVQISIERIQNILHKKLGL